MGYPEVEVMYTVPSLTLDSPIIPGRPSENDWGCSIPLEDPLTHPWYSDLRRVRASPKPLLYDQVIGQTTSRYTDSYLRLHGQPRLAAHGRVQPLHTYACTHTHTYMYVRCSVRLRVFVAADGVYTSGGAPGVGAGASMVNPLPVPLTCRKPR